MLKSSHWMGARELSLVLLFSIISGCSLHPQIERRFEVPAVRPSDSVSAVVAEDHRHLLVSRRNGGACELLRLSVATKKTETIRSLPFCPGRMSIGLDGSLLLVGPNESQLVDQEGRVISVDGRTVGAATAASFLIERDGRLWWRKGEETILLGAGLGQPRILPRSDVVVAISTSGDGETLLRLSAEGTRTLAPAFRAIDSFDVSPDEQEIVLSADQGQGFDVALVSAEGATLHWIFPDRLPERTVSWAPRGNKVSYVIETDGGSILRTVHVPTSFALAVDFPLSRIKQLSWEPKAEKLAVLSSGIDRSSTIEWLRYGGEEREVVFSTGQGSSGEVDRVAGALVRPPRVTRYGERYPLVAWVEPGDALEWRPARQKVYELGAGSAVVSPNAGSDLWDALLAMPWVDQERVVVVYKKPLKAGSAWPSGVTVIVPSPALLDTYRVVPGDHTIVMVPLRPAEEIEAFAAGWVEQLWKGSRR